MRQIGWASLIWGGAILLSRVIGLVREAVIGRVLGGGVSADVFWTAFVLPDFLNYLLAGGALSLVFIPLFAAHLARNDEAAGWRAFSSIANALLLVLCAALVALWMSVPWLTHLVAPGFDATQRAELVALTRLVLPAQLFHLVGGLLSATLQARDRHLLPALAPLVYTLCIIAGGLLGGEAAGAYGFAWGVVVGSIAGPFGLPLLGAWRHGLDWTWRLEWRHPDLRAYAWRSLPIMLGWSIIFVDDWFLKRQASMLAPSAISTLQYAKTLMKVPMGVFGLATGVAAFPTLTRLFALGQREALYDTLMHALRRMLVLALASQVVLTSVGADISRFIYGGKLPLEQHAAIGWALALMSIALWAWAAQTVVARGFYAMGDTWYPTVLGTAVAVAAYPVYVLLARAYGVQGLACASSIAVTLYVALLAAGLARRFQRRLLGAVVFASRMALAVGSGAAAGIGLRRALATVPQLAPHWVVCGVAAGSLGVLVYAAAGWALAVPEVGEVGVAVAVAVRHGIRRLRPWGSQGGI